MKCVVFGGSGALGKEVCRTLLARGAQVGFTYHTRRHEIEGALARQLDVRDTLAIATTLDAFAEDLGGIDGFVNCAAIGVAKTSSGQIHELMSEVGEHGWDEMLAINARASFFAVRHLAKQMRNGNIVLMGSIDGVKPAPSPVHYAASKGALAAMVMAMAKELGPQNIRVNSVAPGVLDGGLSRVLPDELRNEYLKHCGLKRFGRMEEVASLVAWLATDNTFVSGRSIIVDGAL